MKKKTFDLSNIMQSKITWAVVAELLILLVCFIIRPDFFSIKYQPATGMLYGSLIDILNRSAEITIISMGMTLVIALAGTDLSVGSLVALSGALALKFLRWDVLIYNTPGDYTVKPFILVILVPLAVCTLMGLFNGFMISRIGMQPIIATLILMVCGRGFAQIVTNGKQFTTLYSPFRVGQFSFPTDAYHHHDCCGGRRLNLRTKNRVRHDGGVGGHQSQRQPPQRHQLQTDHHDLLCTDCLPLRHCGPHHGQPRHVQRFQ